MLNIGGNSPRLQRPPLAPALSPVNPDTDAQLNLATKVTTVGYDWCPPRPSSSPTRSRPPATGTVRGPTAALPRRRR
jgi:hypothetical protein